MLKKTARLSSGFIISMLLLGSMTGAYADDSASSEGSANNLMTQMDKNVVPENASESTESKIWSAELSLGLNMTSGNSNTLSSNMSFSGSRKIGADLFELVLEGAYGESEIEQELNGTTRLVDEVTDQKATAFAQYKKKFTERFYGYPFVEALHNEPAQIEHRLTAGLGVGYHLIQTENTDLTLDGGSAYIFEKITDEEEDDYMTFYLGVFHKLALTETSRIWEAFKIFPKMEELSDYLIKAEAGIETDISSAFSLRFVVQDNYDTDPPDGAEENDLSVIGSLVFKI